MENTPYYKKNKTICPDDSLWGLDCCLLDISVLPEIIHLEPPEPRPSAGDRNNVQDTERFLCGYTQHLGLVVFHWPRQTQVRMNVHELSKNKTNRSNRCDRTRIS